MSSIHSTVPPSEIRACQRVDVLGAELVGRHEFLELALLGAGASSYAATTTVVALRATRSVPVGLPVVCRRAEHPQQVIAELEGLADRLAVTAEHAEHRVIASGERGADLQRPAHRVVTRFAARDIQHVVQAGNPALSLTRSANCPTASSVRIAS